MTVDAQTVKRIAYLSRLKIEEDKVATTQDEFNKILQWVGQLDEVNTDNVAPLVSVNENTLIMRKDEVTDGNIAEDILANAPMKEYCYFAVPKVLE